MTTGSVWVFVGERAGFPAGVFADLEEAEAWIRTHALSGVLTLYPVGEGAYDWAIRTGAFTPKPDKVIDAGFISRFSSGSMPHFHYEDGEK